jgi:hypothetical protein
MGGRSIKISRRSVLAGFGAGVIDKAFAGGVLEVVGSDDGGFSVFVNFREVWQVSGRDIKQSWGVATVVSVESKPPNIAIAGLLFGKIANVDISFHPAVAGWVCRFMVQLHDLGTVQTEVRFPFAGSPDAEAVAIPVLEARWREAVGLPPGTKITRPRFEIAKRTLAPTLSGPFVFEGMGALRAQGPLELLPAAEKGSPASRLKFRPSERLKLPDGWSIDTDGMFASFPAQKPNDLVVEGAGALEVGKTRFVAAETSSVQLVRERSNAWAWKVDWHLPVYEQAISTPHGQFHLVGSGGTDIAAQGTSRLLQKFSGSAQLRHAALRLPLESKGQNFADLGRLDFENAQQSKVSFKIARFGKVSEASWISLDQVDANPIHIELNSARLRVARQADLFRGCFRFTGLALSKTNKRLILRKLPGDACLLRVDLPPQHLMERSFARQLPNLPGSELKPEQLPMVFDVGRRKGLQTELLQNGDLNFKFFVNNYADRYLKYDDALLPKPSAAVVRLEQIYVGPDGFLSLRSRRVANDLAEEFRKQNGLKIEDVPLGLGPITVGDILRRQRKPQSAPPWTSANADLAFDELLSASAKISDDQALLQNWYRTNNPNARPFYVVGWLKNWLNEFPAGQTRSELQTVLNFIGKEKPPPPDGAQAELDKAYSDTPVPMPPVQRRFAGLTRLVFDMGSKKVSSWPYSLETLMDWGDFSLKVTQRAERVDVGSGTSEESLVKALNDQKISATNDIDTRLLNVVDQAAIRPMEWQTSIELPTRLYLSPAADANFKPSRPPLANGGRVPLWQAELREVAGKSYTLRAVASDDFNPGVFKPLAKRTPDDISPARGVNQGGFLSALDGFDRHQLVGLSSVYGLPAIARQSDEGVEQTSQIAPPKAYKLDGLFKTDQDEQAIYIPRALAFRKLNLSPLGASLDLDALFVPPASVRAAGSDGQPKNLYDAFSVERFHADIAFGRDVTIEVVYKGFLYPIGYRATLVKLTERFYLPWPVAKPQLPIALLRQRLFIQISNPTKIFPAVNQPFQGRGWPAQSMTLDMDHTPDLINPVGFGDVRSPLASWTVQSSGRLDHQSRVGLVFWPRSTPGTAGNIPFRMRIDDRLEPVSMPMIFIDNDAAHDPETMRLLRIYYNDLKQVPAELRQLQHGGVRRRYAAEDKPGDTTFETVSWLVAADARDWQPGNDRVVKPGDSDLDGSHFLVDSAMESVDQPPVYPRLDSGKIRHDSSARFTGNAQPSTNVVYYDAFLRGGFGNRVDGKASRDLGQQAFFVVTDDQGPPLSMGMNGDRSGGVGRPNLPIRAIGRDGPIGSQQKLEASQPLPTFGAKGAPDFFGPDAKVLGLVGMNDIVAFANLDTTVPPVLRDSFEFECKLVRKLATVARLELNTVICGIDGLLDPIKGAYQSLRTSLADLDTALVPLAPAKGGALIQCNSLSASFAVSDQDDPNDNLVCTAQEVTLVLTKAGNLIGELDKLTAAPLAPLLQIVDGTLADATNQLSKGIADSVEQPFANLVSGVRINVVSDVLLPVGEAIALIDAFQDLNAIRPEIIKAFDVATTKTFAQKLPPTLTGLRGQWVSNADIELENLRKNQTQTVSNEIGGLQILLRSFGTTKPPEIFKDLYQTAVVLQSSGIQFFDSETLKKLLSKALKDELLAWWGRSAAPKCVEVLNAFKAVRMALVANAFDPGVCRSPDLCVALKTVPTGATGGLCLLLWQVCQYAPILSKSSGNLARSYAALASAAIDLVDVEKDAAIKCSDPNNFDQVRHDLTRGLQRLGGAKGQFIESLKAWAGDILPLVEGQLAPVAASGIGAAAANALGVLTPTDADIANFTSELSPIVGDDAALTLNQQMAAAVAAANAQKSSFAGASTPAEVAKAAEGLNSAIDDILAKSSQSVESAISQATLRAALPQISDVNASVDQLVQNLDSGYQAVKQMRDDLRDKGLQDLQNKLKNIGVTTPGTTLNLILNVDNDPNLVSACNGTPVENEGLDQEKAVISCIAKLSPGLSQLEALIVLFGVWSAKPPALVRLVTELGSRAKKVITLPTQANFIDVAPLRQALTEIIQDAVPSNRHLGYTWELPFNSGKMNIGDGSLAKFILPDKLTLDANTDIDLLKPAQTPKFQVNGRLGGFGVDIWGESVILHFHPFTFSAGSGSSPHFSADLSSVDIGAKLVFLAVLAAYFQAESGDDPSGGDGELPNGPYIIPRDDGPGLKAGYHLAIGDVELGNLAIFGLTFDAHCEMPFDGTNGAVRVGLASPDAPFLITFAPYGGRGHFLLESGPTGPTGGGGASFDVGFQYGGAVAVAFGPLQGSAVVMIGFRVQKHGAELSFSGFFVAAFEGQVACFGVAVCFSVTMTLQGSTMTGEAMLSFQFSCGPVKVKYQVKVDHDSGGSMGGKALLESPFDQPRIIPVALGGSVTAVAVSIVPSLLEDWPAYEARYDSKVRAAGRRRRK